MTNKIKKCLEILKDQDYTCPQSDSNSVAERCNLPHFSEVFFKITSVNGNIPLCRDFLIAYCKYNKKKLDTLCNNSFGKITKKDILIRVKRSYPSLVRDYHFFLLAREFFGENNVSSSFEDDKNGIDCTITYKGEKFYIHLYVDSPQSRAFRKKKDNRHNFNGHHLDIPIQLRWYNKYGDFYLYSECHCVYANALMNKILNENYNV